jgi:hypothetical protein
MCYFAWDFILHGYFLEGWSLVKVNLAIFFSSCCKSERPIRLESNRARLTLEMLRKATLVRAYVPLNDTRADRLIVQPISGEGYTLGITIPRHIADFRTQTLRLQLAKVFGVV